MKVLKRQRIAQFKSGSPFDPYALRDPACNIHTNEASGLTHKYSHTLRFALTDRCTHGCEYCYEAGRVFGRNGDRKPGNPLEKRVEDAIAYLRTRPEIYDVILSGGEPLMLTNEELDFVLQNLSGIGHLKHIRFCTYSVIKTPERIDNNLLSLLERFSSRFAIRMVLHVTNPEQLTEKTKEVVQKLIRSGTTCFSQVPLLKGINIFDDIEKSVDFLRQFLKKLVEQCIQPYYFVVKMAVPETERFTMSLERIAEIFKPLLQHDRDSAGMELTFKLMVPAPETKVFIYPETQFRYDKARGGYLISADGREIFFPHEGPTD